MRWRDADPDEPMQPIWCSLLACFFAGVAHAETNLEASPLVGGVAASSIEQNESEAARDDWSSTGVSQGGGAEAVLLQSWGHSFASASPDGASGRVAGWLFQSGDNNRVALHQDGADNLAVTVQYGDSNLLELNQSGDGNHALLMQGGVGLALIVTQTDGASIAIAQGGP